MRCLVLPGFSKLFEQTGSVLVPPSPKPPLHLPFRMASLLAKTFYGGLRTSGSKSGSNQRAFLSAKTHMVRTQRCYLRGVFVNFTVVSLQHGDVRGSEPCGFFDAEHRGQRCRHKPARKEQQPGETKEQPLGLPVKTRITGYWSYILSQEDIYVLR